MLQYIIITRYDWHGDLR